MASLAQLWLVVAAMSDAPPLRQRVRFVVAIATISPWARNLDSRRLVVVRKWRPKFKTFGSGVTATTLEWCPGRQQFKMFAGGAVATTPERCPRRQTPPSHLRACLVRGCGGGSGGFGALAQCISGSPRADWGDAHSATRCPAMPLEPPRAERDDARASSGVVPSPLYLHVFVAVLRLEYVGKDCMQFSLTYELISCTAL